jgi:single-stranded DNA-specific DHH superfamily exonuclease
MKQLLKEKQFESWKHNTYLLLTDYCSLLRDWRREYAPEALDEPFKDKYLESLKELEKIEYYCDFFLYGTRADLEEFKQNEERLVKRIEQRVREQKQHYLGQAAPVIGE